MDIIAELKRYNILGRSGSGFPAHLKWQMVKDCSASKKYIVCNGSEGEPNNEKDKYILEKYPEYVIEGIGQALGAILNSSAFIYLRKDYFQKFALKLKKLSKGQKIEVIKKTGGYLAGEETAVCQAIETGVAEPKIKPPFPSEAGIFGYPTLINNIETFFCAGKIAKSEYNNERFYTISGDIKNAGVFELPKDCTIKQILEETGNMPKFDFFVQAGGGAMGEILLFNELNKQIQGIGCVIVFDKKKTNPHKLLRQWANFFMHENCDKCTPCREGMYRINEIISKKDIDKGALEDIYFVLERTSFCPLGKNAPTAFKTLIEKIIK